MAYKDNISRLSRLTAILLKLQSSSVVNVVNLSEHFGVSKRTIYRDLGSLEEAGVPIIQIEGKGFSLMKDYNLPPVMFSESEANAIILGKKIMEKTKDKSLIEEFNKAVDKIKSVLNNQDKEKADFLEDRTIVGKNWRFETTSSLLPQIQIALTNFDVLQIEYKKDGEKKPSTRKIEPFAIYHNTMENWLLVAWCQMRKEFRNFRIDRIEKIKHTNTKFEPHKLTLEEFVEIQRKKHFKGVTKG